MSLVKLYNIDIPSDVEQWYTSCGLSCGELRRAQLAKSTLLTSMLIPLGSF